MDGHDHPIKSTSIFESQTPQQTMSCSLMASLAQHLPSLLLTSFLYTFINGNSAQPSNTACPSFDCGNGNTISYPFWHQNQQFEYCGYPGFNISCINHNPMLHLSNNLYRVKMIKHKHSDNSIALAYDEVNEANCPRVAHDVTLSTSSLFNYSLGNKMLRFYYNCTLYPPSLKSIACLDYGSKRSYVFKVGAIPEFDWERYCESNVTVPVIEKAVDGVLVNDFTRALQDGFKLTWQPDSVCQSCEASGGFCRYSNGLHKNFFCLCSNGHQSVNCHNKTGDASIMFEPNVVAIGALIFGGLISAATVFYLIHRKKVGMYKPVSNRVSSGGK